MHRRMIRLYAALFRLAVIMVVAGHVWTSARADHYAAQNGQTSAPPYSSWATAASNIQEAVNAAPAGGTVWVGAGRYKLPPEPVTWSGATNIVYINKPLTLRSSNSVPETTIIDGEGKYRGIAWEYLAHSSSNFIVDGFTIANCTALGAEKGGGLFFYSWTWTATVQNCIIVSNGATTIQGGGMFAEQAHHSYASRQIVSNCVFRGNTGRNGGAFHLARFSAPGKILSSVIRDNTANFSGGGGYLWGNPDVWNCEFYGNKTLSASSSDYGGGACNGAGTFRNCLIRGNYSRFNGGGVALINRGRAYFYNCTIVSNKSDSTGWGPTGGGIRGIYASDAVTLVNSIVAFNRSGSSPDDLTIASTTSTNYYIHSCLGVTNGFGSLRVWSNSITNDPQFVDFTAANYRLQLGSLCIGTGTNQALMAAEDLDGNARISGGRVDMGCYEFPFYIQNTPLSVSNTLWLGRAVTNLVDVANLGMPTNAVLNLWTGSPWLTSDTATMTLAKDVTNQIDLTSAALTTGAHTDALRIVLTNASLSNRVNYVGNYNLTNTLPVALDVLDFTCDPAGITNTISAGEVAPSRSFNIIKTGAARFDYTITTNGGATWLTVAPGGGGMTNNATNSITVTYSTAGLASGGSYTSVLRVASTNWGGKTQDVTVIMNVDPLRIAPAPVTNVALQGLNALSQTVTVHNAGAGAYAYTWIPSVSWLNILPNSGTATHTLTNSHTLHYISSGLAPGTHEGSIYLTSPDHGGVTQQVAVSLTVLSQPELAVTPLYLEQTISRGEQPANLQFQVWNAGHNPRVRMEYTATGDVAWLKTFAPGQSTGETSNVPVRFNDMTGYLSGSYVGHVTVVGRDAGTGYAPIGSFVMTSRLEVVVNIAPSAPGWIAASSGTDTEKVIVEWEPVQAQQVEYEVWRGVTRDFDERWVVRIAGGVQRALYYDSTVMPGALHYYWVRAVSDVGSGALSGYDSGYRGLSVPGGVRASAGTYRDRVRVRWTGVDRAQAYEVWVSGSRQASPSSLVPGRGERALVRSCVGGGDGESAWVCGLDGDGRVGAEPGVNEAHFVRTAAGSEMRLAGAHHGPAGHENISDPTPLRRYIFPGSSRENSSSRENNWQLAGTMTGLEFFDLSVAEGASYRYKVRAIRHGDVIAPGAFSAMAEGYVLGRPLNLAAGQGTQVGSVPLSWSGGDGADEFEIWRKGRVDYQLIGTSSSRTFNDTDVEPGTRHTYKVRGRNASGATEFSATATGYAASAGVDLAVVQPVMLPKIVSVSAGIHATAQSETVLTEQTPPSEADGNSFAAPPRRYIFPGSSRENSSSREIVVSLRLYHRGGAALAGDDGTVQISWTGSNRTSGVTYILGTHQQRVTLGAGQSVVLTPPSTAVRFPAVGIYDVWVEVVPAWPSQLAETAPWDNRAQVVGSVQVRAIDIPGWWGFNDYSGDAISDLVMHVDGNWYIRTVDGRILAWAVPFGAGQAVYGLDYDGDNKAEPVVYDTASGGWQGMLSASGYARGGLPLGGPGYIPVPGDYTGNGLGNAAVYGLEDGRWYILDDSFQPLVWGEVFGGPGLVPVGGDYDGDGIWDLTVYDTNTGRWYSRGVDGELKLWGEVWGGPGYVPVMGDYDGDGAYDLAVYQAATGRWSIRTRAGLELLRDYWWGGPGYIPVPGDYDGDGVWDLALYRMHTGQWYIRSIDRGIILREALWGLRGYLPAGYQQPATLR